MTKSALNNRINKLSQNIIGIYTDGSCNPKHKIGAWAAVILTNNNETVINGYEFNTTHNRMELLSAVKSLEYIKNEFSNDVRIRIYSDSQYLVKLNDKKNRLERNDFLTKAGNSIRNIDLVKMIMDYIETMNIEFIKVPAHGKKQDYQNFNRKVDMLSRKIVREQVKKLM